jgi:hypothetical protein
MKGASERGIPGGFSKYGIRTGSWTQSVKLIKRAKRPRVTRLEAAAMKSAESRLRYR